MNPRETLGAYLGVSIGIAFLDRSSVSTVDVAFMLMAGTAGSLELFLLAVADAIGGDFQRFDAILVFVGIPLLLWLLGGCLLYQSSKKKWRDPWPMLTALLWLGGACWNTCWLSQSV